MKCNKRLKYSNYVAFSHFHGTAVNNSGLVIAEKMKVAFSEWINNGHNNFEDENTCILQIELIDGVLFSHGTRYDIDFTE